MGREHGLEMASKPASQYGIIAVNFTLTTLPYTAAKSSRAAAGVNFLPGQQAIASSSCGVRVCRDTVLISTKLAFYSLYRLPKICSVWSWLQTLGEILHSNHNYCKL